MGLLNYFRKPTYLYHGTRLENIPSIQTEGLDPKYFIRKIVFLSDNAGFAAMWGNLEALVRVNKSDLQPNLLKKNIRYEGEYEYESTIPPERLEIRKVSLNKINGELELAVIN